MVIDIGSCRNGSWSCGKLVYLKFKCKLFFVISANLEVAIMNSLLVDVLIIDSMVSHCLAMKQLYLGELMEKATLGLFSFILFALDTAPI